MRTARDGTLSYRAYHGLSDDGAVYFVSSMYAGVAYFTPPLAPGDGRRATDAVITVFDTTSRAVPMTVRGHHVIVGDRGFRRDASGDGSLRHLERHVGDARRARRECRRRELVGGAASAARARPRWWTGTSAGRGEVRSGTRAGVFSPFAPGLKQLALRYTLDDDAFPLKLAWSVRLACSKCS